MMRDIDKYQASYVADYNFEKVMVKYRHQFLIDSIRANKCRTIIEIGCGAELLYEKFVSVAANSVQMWVIVEPSEVFAKNAEDRKLPNLKVVRGFFEESIQPIQKLMDCHPDYIICSSLIHEVQSARSLLSAISAVMGSESVLHVNAPNALSFHRRLALAMGIIPGLSSLSERNVTMQQHRVYDQESLSEDLTSAGFEVIESGGYFIKPFTHKQMEAVSMDLGDAVLDGLFKMGRTYPEWASEIYLEARLK